MDGWMDGFKIKDTAVMGRALTNKEMVVSFLGLPLYITDEEIREKLRLWEVARDGHSGGHAVL